MEDSDSTYTSWLLQGTKKENSSEVLSMTPGMEQALRVFQAKAGKTFASDSANFYWCNVEAMRPQPLELERRGFPSWLCHLLRESLSP